MVAGHFISVCHAGTRNFVLIQRHFNTYSQKLTHNHPTRLDFNSMTRVSIVVPIARYVVSEGR